MIEPMEILYTIVSMVMKNANCAFSVPNNIVSTNPTQPRTTNSKPVKSKSSFPINYYEQKCNDFRTYQNMISVVFHTVFD